MSEDETPQQSQQLPQSQAGESWEYDLHVPNDPRAVTVCRRTLRLVLTLHGLIGLVDTAELLAAELVSNAVRHTEGPAALRVRWADGVLWIGAWDADPEPPRFPAESDESGGFGEFGEREDGRGLGLVRACSGLWGWRPAARSGNRGKYVWCELATT
ncbi:ATP-binding protein [Streptomyces sp. NPDC014882]|uniref:ATP-binding protein n=1 Tax=Streptomyces sp. NPDC014882 TaxID=3364927 RepID=UPI0036F7B623